MSHTVILEDGKDFITLGQFLKYNGMISTGGQAKWFLSEFEILVNGEREDRRGKKLYVGDEIRVEDNGTFTITKE